MRVTVISPEESVFEGDATAIVAPAHDGEVGILPRHAPFMTLLGEGKLTVRQDGGSDRVLYVRGGLLQVLDDVVNVIAEHAEGGTDET